MIVIRPINQGDYDGLWALAHQTGPGFSSLQPKEDQVRERLKRAIASFEGRIEKEHALYFFVLEETSTKKLLGVTAIEAGLGLDEPWYNFRINTVVHASQRFDVFNQIQTLTLCNDYTGCSELCTLFLLPEYRHIKGAGHLLSKSRFLFIAAHQALFNERLIAEMRGYLNGKEESPFWEALGRKFIGLDFVEADQALSRNRSFIIELMPRHAVYLNMLPDEARDVVGLTHSETMPALKLLEKEGLMYRNYIAPFDAGPVVEAQVKDIRAVKESCLVRVRIAPYLPETSNERWLISNDGLADFRCILASVTPDEESVTLSTEQAEALDVNEGSYVRLVTQYPQEES